MIGSRSPLPPESKNKTPPKHSRPKSKKKTPKSERSSLPKIHLVRSSRPLPKIPKSRSIALPKPPNRSPSLLSTRLSVSDSAGLSGISGLAISLVSPSRRAGLRHRLSTLSLSGLSVSCSVTALRSLIEHEMVEIMDKSKEQKSMHAQALTLAVSSGAAMMHLYEKNKTGEEAKNDSSGIFWDNDSLAALLALELKVTFLFCWVMLRVHAGGPPSDPQSKLIDTYIKEKHQGEITFGGKSRVGRGAYMDQTSGFHGLLVVPFDGRVQGSSL
ncbi:hypothetical protein Syun_022709 [Stephania yunnanensis]|uniref:Uncharacterized protein n=1 Tax=Stephania yunnanensis TaxID=152371 RepID=A0AAP0FDZ4_9MAGN